VVWLIFKLNIYHGWKVLNVFKQVTASSTTVFRVKIEFHISRYLMHLIVISSDLSFKEGVHSGTLYLINNVETVFLAG